MVDLPATDLDGNDIVAGPHGQEPAEFVNALKRACATYHGTAGPAFVSFLCNKCGPAGVLAKRLRAELDEATRLLTPEGAGEEAGRVARKFALVWVAGKLACEAGVLPFAAEEVEGAVGVMLGRWLAVHGMGSMERALEQLRSFILTQGESRFRG